jgi:HSP20 family molecular chaperone IbpA
MSQQVNVTPRDAESQAKNQNRNQNQNQNQARYRAVAPPVDVYENREEFLLVVDMPGVIKEDLRIHLDKGQLTLEARRPEAGNGKYLASEVRSTDYRRAFSVPQGIDVDKVSADLQQGILRVHLPKSAAIKPRQIEVQSA